MADITGQSAKFEPPLNTPINTFYPTALERYINAQNNNYYQNVYQKEIDGLKFGENPISINETILRTRANAPRHTLQSNNIFTIPLISGNASNPMNSNIRNIENIEGRNIMLINTILESRNNPKIRRF